jgi:hypothetical protein
MRVYSIKQNTKSRKQKKKQRSCFTAFKNSVFTRQYTALQTVDVQELVTVQQMANGNFVKQVVVRRIVWQYNKYFFYKVYIFRRNLS